MHHWHHPFGVFIVSFEHTQSTYPLFMFLTFDIFCLFGWSVVVSSHMFNVNNKQANLFVDVNSKSVRVMCLLCLNHFKPIFPFHISWKDKKMAWTRLRLRIAIPIDTFINLHCKVKPRCETDAFKSLISHNFLRQF